MIFVFDLDDTITETDYCSEVYISNFIKEHNLSYKQIASKVRFAEAKFDWTNEEALDWYKTYGDQMMLEFTPKEGSVESINKLYDDGHKIIIATARSTDWHTDPKGITLKWLENVGLKYHKIYFGRSDKEKICLDEKADVFVDDDLRIIKRVKDDGASKYVFVSNTLYNSDFELDKDIYRFDDYKEFMKKITSLENRR